MASSHYTQCILGSVSGYIGCQEPELAMCLLGLLYYILKDFILIGATSSVVSSI